MFFSFFDNMMFSIVPIFVAIIFIIVTVSILLSAGKGVKTYFDNNSQNETSVPAKLTSKRTHVWGGSGNTAASTSYYLTFELEDGDRHEFSVSSKLYAMLAEGDIGMLTHQGTRFLHFERDRF